jgi:hypothetical protein
MGLLLRQHNLDITDLKAGQQLIVDSDMKAGQTVYSTNVRILFTSIDYPLYLVPCYVCSSFEQNMHSVGQNVQSALSIIS